MIKNLFYKRMKYKVGKSFKKYGIYSLLLLLVFSAFNPQYIEATGSSLRKMLLFDLSGKDLLFTDDSNIPTELYDSNGLNLDLTTESNVPVALRDSNGLELVLKDDVSVPVTPVADYYIDIVRGTIPGQTTEFKFGRSSAVNATESVIWDGGGIYTFIEVAETLDLVSTDAQDNAAGTGARSIIIYGLDLNHNEIFEIVIPTGLTPLTTTASFLRVYRALVITSGTNTPIGNANSGTITITGTDTASTLALMQPHNGQTLMTPYTVPAGKTFLITGISASCGQGKNVLLKAKIRNGPTSSHAFSVKYTLELYEASFTTLLQTPLAVPEKTDICWTGETSVGTIAVSASYGGILIDN